MISLLLYCLFVIIFPARIYTNSYSVFQVLILLMIFIVVAASIKEYRRRREGSGLNLIVLIIFSATVISDFFYYRLWISTDELVSLGLLFYLFTQSMHLARKFSRSFEQAERLSQELQQLNESLEKKIAARTIELQNMYQELQKAESARRRLLSSVSHELQTPLTSLQGYVKAMLDGVVLKDDSTYLRSIYSDTQMMAHIIRDLHQLSKLESGQIKFKFESINIYSYFETLYLEQKRPLEEKGYSFQFHASILKNTVCRIDPVRLKQVYINLIVNAQKFTPVGGTITLKMEIPDDSKNYVKVSVIDTGCGISKEALPFIFERFYKDYSTQNGKERGAGLGLAIAKEIIERHNGLIGVTVSLNNRLRHICQRFIIIFNKYNSNNERIFFFAISLFVYPFSIQHKS